MFIADPDAVLKVHNWHRSISITTLCETRND